MNVHILQGDIEYLHEDVGENAKNHNPKNLDFVGRIRVEIKHLKNEGHEIKVYVTTGYVDRTKKDDIILTVDSCSHFKISRYIPDVFKKPASTELIKTLADIAKTAISHNSGIFSVIREDHDLKHLRPQPVPFDNIKTQIFNDINRHLLS